jgi:Ca2+-binding RTX toxin-like protein
VNATVTAAWTASGNTVNQGVVNITSHGLAVNLAAITSTAMGNLGYHVSNTGTATTLTGSALSDWLTGAAGNDTLVGGGGVDVLNGAEGSDLYIVALAGDHAAAEFSDSGVSGTDEVRFTSTVANSTLTLYADDVGIEKVVIGTGTSASAVATGTSALNVNGSAMTEDISLVGNAGANVLSSGSGDDSLQGGSGHDTLNGGAGFDQLRGGNGNDILTGGADIDWFIFDTAANASTNKDTLKDFSSGEDLLMFSRAIYGGLSTSALGALDIEAFWSGANVTTAHDVSDRFIYNTTSGALYYDADGAGGNSALQVAVMGLTTHPTLACTDFFVVA